MYVQFINVYLLTCNYSYYGIWNDIHMHACIQNVMTCNTVHSSVLVLIENKLT